MFQRKILLVMLAIGAAALSAPRSVRAEQSYAVITQDGVSMKTRDGVKLYADIYRPKADGKFPVILMRTPYDKSVGWAVGPGPRCRPGRGRPPAAARGLGGRAGL